MSFFRFRKRIKLFPGLWINLSKKGVSVSAGVKGLTVNSRGRSTVSLPGTGLSYVVTPRKRALHTRDRAKKEGNLSALWDKFVEDFPKVDQWVPTSETTLAEVEEHLAILRSSKTHLQGDFDAWKTASDAYLAELKPLISEESYEHIDNEAKDERRREIFSTLTALEDKLEQVKEILTPINVTFKVAENAPGPPQFHFISPNGEGVMDMFGNVLSVVNSNALFSAETKKVQDNVRGNMNGFVDKMNKLWAEAHAREPVGEVETRDRTAIYVDDKTVIEHKPTLVNRLSKLEHTKEPVGEGETWDRTAIYVDGKAVIEHEPTLVDRLSKLDKPIFRD